MEQTLKGFHSQEAELSSSALWPRISIVLIVLVAFGLRFWSIDFGLPFPYHVDEVDYTVVALNLACTGDFHTTLIQPQTYVHTVVLWVASKFDASICANYSQELASSQALYLSRLISAIFGTLTVFVIYRLGDKLYGFPVGIIAALFTAINFIHVRESHFGTPDVTAGFFLVASLLSYVNIAQNRTLRNYLIATVLTVMAVSGRITLGLLVLPFAYVHFMPFFSTTPKSFKLLKDYIFNRRVFICLMVAAVVFVLLTPILLLNPRAYLGYWHNFFLLSRFGGFGRFRVDELSAPLFYARTFIWSEGLLLPLVIGLGMVWAVWKRKLGDILVLAFTVSYMLVAIRAGTYFSRYIIPVALPVGILAARFLWEVWPKKIKPVGLIIVLIVVSVQPLLYITQFNNLIQQKDTRTIALEWINSNIPQGAKMASEYNGPFIDTTRYNVTALDIHGSWQTEMSIYCEQEFHYIIDNSFIDDLTLIKPEEEAAKQAFYAELDRSAKLAFEIKPYSLPTRPPFYFDQIYSPITAFDQYDRPGPTIKIYEIKPDVSPSPCTNSVPSSVSD